MACPHLHPDKTDARTLLDKTRHLDITLDRAYLALPVALVFKHPGKLKKLPSIFTASLHKEPGGWRMQVHPTYGATNGKRFEYT